MPPETRPFAVVTGASSGIGFEFAKIFAKNGFDLLINAEDDELDAAHDRLKKIGHKVTAIKADLTQPEQVEKLYDKIRKSERPVDALVLNAGVGEGGDFATGTSLQKELQIVDLNCRSVVHLCKLVVADMVEQDSGRILITSSIASTMPGAFQAVYNASKSFDQSFAIALRSELKSTNVSVTSLMPGPTDTEFFERAGLENTKVGSGDKDDPAEVAQQGFEALMAGKERVVSGSFTNRLQAVGGRFIPDRVKAEIHRRMAAPGSAR